MNSKRTALLASFVTFASIAGAMVAGALSSGMFDSKPAQYTVTTESAPIVLSEMVIVGDRGTITLDEVTIFSSKATAQNTKAYKCKAPRALVQDTDPGMERNYDGHQTVRECGWE